VYNAFACPLFVGTNEQLKAADTPKIIDTDKGMKYSSKKNIFIIVSLGIPLLCDNKLSDESVAAIIFHELGHGFQQFQGNTLFQQQSQAIFISAIDLMKEIIFNLSIANIKKIPLLIIQLIVGLFNKFGASENRIFVMAKSAELTERTLRSHRVNKGTNNFKDIFDLITIAIQTIFNFIKIIILVIPIPIVPSILVTLIHNPLYIVDLVLHGWYMKQGKKDEVFADTFAAKYGLGKDMGKTLVEFNKQGSKIYTNFDWCPLIRTTIEFNSMWFSTFMTALDPHPENYKRIDGIYKNIEKELVDNPDMPKNMRVEIENQLKHIRTMYNTMIDPNEYKDKHQGLALFWWVMGTVFGLKKKSGDTDVAITPRNINTNDVKASMISIFKNNSFINNGFSNFKLPDLVDAIDPDMNISEESLSDYMY
jgi:Zn-dependent protease with chaperone function